MILAIKYTVKGVKKGHKKYKQHQLEKEQKLLESRGQLPDLQDPSRELDATCLAEVEPSRSRSRAGSTSSDGSAKSSSSAVKALENDPGFKEYMDRHRSLYLQQHRDRALPPSYTATMQSSPAHTASPSNADPMSATSHCSCHECLAMRGSSSLTSPSSHYQSTGPSPAVPELPTPGISLTASSGTELPANHETDLAKAEHRAAIVEADSTPIMFELPGNLPSILPDLKPRDSVATPELPANQVDHT